LRVSLRASSWINLKISFIGNNKCVLKVWDLDGMSSSMFSVLYLSFVADMLLFEVDYMIADTMERLKCRIM
jgi:hypothetical protein